MNFNFFDNIGKPNRMITLRSPETCQEEAVIVFFRTQAHVMFFAFRAFEYWINGWNRHVLDGRSFRHGLQSIIESNLKEIQRQYQIFT